MSYREKAREPALSNVGAGRSEALDRLFQAQGIRDCLLRGARGADRLDAELMRSSWWADAAIRYGGGSPWSPAELLGAWFPVAGACVATQHYLFNHRLELDGDIGYTESYYIAVFAVDGDVADGSLLPFCGSVAPGEVAFQGGRYVDRLERRAGEWRIARRQVCGDWFATADGAQTTVLRQSMTDRPGGGRSQRNRSDPSYGEEGDARKSEPLDELLAVEAIRDCLHRYARGIDRLDKDLLASVFASPDEEREFIDSLFAHGDTQPGHSHYITNLRVNLDGATAGAEAYFLSVHCDAGRAEPDLTGSELAAGRPVHLIGGRYVLDMVQESGEWRIAKRTALGEWQAVGDGTHLDAFLRATGNKSKRSREDASYDPLVSNGVSRTVDELLEREAVRDCLARYARGCDRLDKELIESAFVDVAPQFIDYMFGQADIRPVQNHYWTNLRVELAGDLAFVEAYYVSVHGYVDGASTGFIEGTTSKDDINFVGGRYIRWFEKLEADRWGLRNLSSSKTYPPPSGGLGDWHARVNGSGLSAYREATGNGGHPRGSRDDPSYARP
jgi:hypothetical protein